MAEDPFLPFMEEVIEIRYVLEAVCAGIRRLKAGMRSVAALSSRYLEGYLEYLISLKIEIRYVLEAVYAGIRQLNADMRSVAALSSRYWEGYLEFQTSLNSKEWEPPRIGGRRVAYAIMVSAVILLSFVYLYLIGYIDRGGSKAGSSSSLDFRDIYISIVLFQAAYVWIKFRDVIPPGAVYRRPNSGKFEPRIKFPVTRGVGGESKRIPLGLFDTFAEGEVAYRIAAFYCKKRKHTGRLDLGGGASFPIPALSVDPHLPYKEKVKEVGAQVLKVYAEFEELKASRTLPPSVPGLAFAMPTEEGHLLATSPIEQLRQPLNSGMDSSMQCQGSQLGPNIHNGVDFNNPGCFLPVLVKTQHELLDAYKQHECLKAQVSRTEVENMGWEIKYSELERKYLELKQKNSELERENGLLNHQIMQSQLETLHQEQEFDTNRFLSIGHEESLAR